MKYTLRAFFYPDEETHSCHVEIPDININLSITPEKWTMASIIKETRKELAMHMYLSELEKIDLRDVKRDIVSFGYQFAEDIEVDTTEAARRVVSIERIDISDD